MIKPEISEVTEFVFGIRYGNIELRRPSSITSSDRRLRKPTPTPHVLYKISNQSHLTHQTQFLVELQLNATTSFDNERSNRNNPISFATSGWSAIQSHILLAIASL